jgi:membrane protein
MATEPSAADPDPQPSLQPGLQLGLFRRFLASPACSIVKRIAVGCYEDGLIHAGNLAYMALLAIFPFFVTGAAAVTLLGGEADRAAAVSALLSALPPVVDDVIQPVAIHVIEARSGWLLWAGGLVGLWTVGSLIETIRDILRRAYGTPATRAFWQYRLFSTGIIIVAVLLLILSLFLQVTINAANEVIGAYFPQFTEALSRLAWTRIVSGLGLFGAIYLLFYTLTPARYRHRRYPKWPGAVLVTAWWVLVSMGLPWAIRMLFAYDLTYGSLAGIMIALFFFWLVGLGMVAGAELNAALAGPQTRGRIGREADIALGLQENS